MPADPQAEIDAIMEQASERLAATDYIACESLCLEALAMARRAGDFDRYARILMPLQEARRQRRQIAVDAGVIVLAGPRREANDILDERAAGCLMLIDPPYTMDDEAAIRAEARRRGQFVEVLTLDSDRLRQCFEDQMEREGDAAVAAIDPKASITDRIDTMAAALERAADHEIAHQRLAALANEAARQADAE